MCNIWHGIYIHSFIFYSLKGYFYFGCHWSYWRNLWLKMFAHNWLYTILIYYLLFYGKKKQKIELMIKSDKMLFYTNNFIIWTNTHTTTEIHAYIPCRKTCVKCLRDTTMLSNLLAFCTHKIQDSYEVWCKNRQTKK